MNCLVLEDQRILLDLLCSMVENFSEVDHIFKTSSISAGSKIANEHKIDVAILDLFLEDGYSVDLAIYLTTKNPDIKIIILSGLAQEFICPEGLLRSVVAIIDKCETFDSLRDCLNKLIKPSHCNLTERQKTIYRLIGEGKSTKEIAKVLDNTPSTVETHRKAIAKKLGISGAELIRRAVLNNTVQTIES